MIMGLDTTFYKINCAEELKDFRKNSDLFQAIYKVIKDFANFGYEYLPELVLDKFQCLYIIKTLEKDNNPIDEQKYKEALKFLKEELLPMYDKLESSQKILVTTY